MSSDVTQKLGNLDLDSSPWDDAPSAGYQQTLGSPPNGTQKPEEPSFQASAPPPPQPAAEGNTKEEPKASIAKPATAPRAPRAKPVPRRGGGTVAQLEALDNSLDPLGPLGVEPDDDDEADSTQISDRPPQPPVKERAGRLVRHASGTQASSRSSMLDSTGLEDDDDEEELGRRPRHPPPVAGPVLFPGSRSIPPSVPIEQAAKPNFEITVGDPHKIGDITSSHIVYSVRTKTSSKAYKEPEFTVTRRYRDFLWLYDSMINNNPGVIVPPPPEKQSIGRFEQSFVESRRAALERMLNKAALHPILQTDGDLKIFLESESFNSDIKQKGKEAVKTESSGLFGSIGGAFSGGLGSKFIETDDYFLDRKAYLDALEAQLKNLLRAIETVVKQRRDLAEAANEFGNSLHSLSMVELSSSLSSPLVSLSDLQIRIKELYERQAEQDDLTLGITIDEYIRLIGSVKLAFQQRQKAYHSWHTAESDLIRKKTTYERLQRQGKTQQDRLNQMNSEVADSEKRFHQARLQFEEMGRLMKSELDRFEREKVDDFKSGVETFLESAVEAQKELIELWETFLLQLDREEEEEALAPQKVKAPKPKDIPPSTSPIEPEASETPIE